MIKVTGVAAFEDNYIWLIGNDHCSSVVVVDPGDSQPVIKACSAAGLTPVAILITHHHWDHTDGVKSLVDRYQIPVYGPANSHFRGITHPLREGDKVTLNEIDANFTVMATPGHTLDHICYHGHDLLFCGDTLFAGGCGRVFEGTPAQMQASLAKIRALPDNTQVYCAHEYTQANLGFASVAEPDNQALKSRQAETDKLRSHQQPTVPSLLKTEKETNPFLRWDELKLIKAAEHFAGKTLATPAEVFATVRYWKDTLD